MVIESQLGHLTSYLIKTHCFTFSNKYFRVSSSICFQLSSSTNFTCPHGQIRIPLFISSSIFCFLSFLKNNLKNLFVFVKINYIIPLYLNYCKVIALRILYTVHTNSFKDIIYMSINYEITTPVVISPLT